MFPCVLKRIFSMTELIEPTDIVLKYAPWSTSKADTLHNCPRKFKYQYIDKVRGLTAPKMGDALVGKAVHKLLEYAITFNRPIDKYIKTVIAEFSLVNDDASRFSNLVPAAEALVKRLGDFQRRWKASPPRIEQRLAVSLSGETVGFFDDKKGFFRGVLDLSYHVKDKNHMVILDHKTGKDRGLKYYTNQFDGYLWLSKCAVPLLEGIQVGVNFLQTNRTEFSTFKYTHDPLELRNNVVRYLNKATARVDNLEVVRPGPLCGWCDFYTICPLHTGGVHEETIDVPGGESSDTQRSQPNMDTNR
jgi:hypothetical protein